MEDSTRPNDLAPSDMSLRYLSLDHIDPNPFQPRQHLAGLEELADSIREKGLLQPITVRPAGDRWQIIHGERRWRAARLARLTEIPATIREATDDELRELALVENLQRHDLTPMEEAEAFQALQAAGWTQERIARLVGKTQSYVAHKLRLLRMPAPLTFYLQEGVLTENHLRQIATLEGIYSPDLLRHFDDLDGYPWGDPERAAWGVLCAIRPEEYPVAYPLPPSPVVIAACDRFVEYVLKHTSDVPQWVVAGFWWAALAVRHEITVADLARLMRNWRERFDHAVVWWQIHRDKEPGTDRERIARWWRTRADLEHSGVLQWLARAPAEWLVSVYSRVLPGQGGESISLILPSAYQHGIPILPGFRGRTDGPRAEGEG